MLFDEIIRTFTGPALYAEPEFDYYNRSARSDISSVRDVLEQWFADYPNLAKPDVRARFRSSDAGNHRGAFAELYCHAYTKSLGLGPQVHPHIENRRQPDFSLFRGGEFFCFLECTVATEFREGGAAFARLHTIYDALNRLQSPNFFIGIDIIRHPDRSISAAPLRRFITQKLANLDPDVVGQAMQNSQSLQESSYYWTWQEDGFEIGFYPIPKSDAARGRPGLRPLGTFSSGPFARAVDDRKPILESLQKKATRYGVLNAPYIIAIDAMEEAVDTFDIMGALFGEEQTIIDRRTLRTSERRAPNGLWYGPRGVQNKRVSGVLFLKDIGPWNIAKRNPVLWHNPWATHPIAPDMWPGFQKIPNRETQRMELREGRLSHEIFNLPAEWPTPDPAWAR
jgi:hypothetical protein